jgi:tRNA A-37 threonylcarbamoyl transferase component Bud32
VTATNISGTASIEAIPGYRVLQLIERGGMGAVYLAEDQTLQRHVAIKVIHPEFTDDSDYQKRFTREALTVAAFQHPNIVTVHASGWTDGKQYIVMEYVAGGALFELMTSTRLTPSTSVALASKLADALAYAHERDVIHRDFKPRNVLLRENGTPVLSDFGVAKSQATQGSQTAVGLVVGNVRYMAPEQALGEAVTDRVDIYSFGLVLHEMLTGDLPRIHPVRNKSDARPIVRAIGKDLGELVARCLASNPVDRPSAAECRDWLQAYERRASAARLMRPGVVAVTAAVAAIVVVLGVVAWRNGLLRHSPAPSAAATGTVAVPITRLPSSASIFVDARPLSGQAAQLGAGGHDVVAVADGYYGEVRHLTVSAGTNPDPVTFVLEATRLPSFDEQQRFLKLADAPALTQQDLSGVTEPTLATVLQAKRLQQTGQAAPFEALSKDTEMLRRFGDARAAVASLLIGSVQSGHISRSQVTQSLLSASESGDAMASFILAASFRESINASGRAVSTVDPLYQDYCRNLALAARQGWGEVAGEYARRDGCPH